jgi:hypothetical protein
MSYSGKNIDPITLSVVRGVLETTQREMTLTLEKTARSSVFNLAHDYSTALFNHEPEMILQGQDIPIHLGSLIPAMKAVDKFLKARLAKVIWFCIMILIMRAPILLIPVCIILCSIKVSWYSGQYVKAI